MDQLIGGARQRRRQKRLVSAGRERPKPTQMELDDEPNNRYSDSNLIGPSEQNSPNRALNPIESGNLANNDDNIITKEQNTVPSKRTKASRIDRLKSTSSGANTVKPPGEAEIIASNDRLTMLEEPLREPPSHRHSQLTNGRSIVSSAGSSRTNQTKETQRLGIDNQRFAPEQQNNDSREQHTAGYPIASSNGDQMTLSSSASNQQLLILTFFGGFASFLMFVLVGVILYNWFFAGRRRRSQVGGRKCCQLISMWPISDWPSKQKSASLSCEDSPGKFSVGLNENYGCASGERVQLVERRPPPSNRVGLDENPRQRTQTAAKHLLNSANEHEDIMSSDVCNSSSHRAEHSTEARASLGQVNDGRSSTMVILKRKLAKNSFFRATNRPKVRLMGERMRMFIDDEAKKMRAKQTEGKPTSANKSSWNQRLAAYFGNAGQVDSTPTCGQEEITSNLAAPSDEKHGASAGELVDCDNIELPDEHAARDSDPALKQPEAHDQTRPLLGADKQSNSTGSKYSPASPNNLNNDTCSSTSLFSPSPVALLANSSNPISQPSENSGQLSPWPFNPADWQQQFRLRLVPQREFLGGQQAANCTLGPAPRSQSQNHTPLHTQYNSTGSPQVCRPCCASISPSALNSGQTCCQQQQQQLTHQVTSNNGNGKPAIALYPSGNVAYLDRFNTNGSKCLNNHLKRQYENYYEDEQEEAYRRLTANIGMEFGIGFHHHLHHPISSSQYCNSKADVPHIHDLLQLAPDCESIACSQHSQLNEQHPMLVAPDLEASRQVGPTMVQEQFPAQVNQVNCSCCPPQRNCASFPSNQLSYPPICEPLNRPPFNYGTQGLRSSSDQNQLAANYSSSAGFPVKNDGGSAGDLLTSSASTSLGGSDSGITPSSLAIANGRQPPVPAVCSNPFCACQVPAADRNQPPIAGSLPAAPPMSIIVQQPSIATPPPLQQPAAESAVGSGQARVRSQSAKDHQSNEPSPSFIDETNVSDDLQNENKKEGLPEGVSLIGSGLNSNNEHQHPLNGSKSTSPTTVQPKWRHRRHRLNMKRQTDLGCATHRTNSSVPRRVSIAGDQVSMQPPPCPARAQDLPASPSNTGHSQLFQHRASVASEGGWLQESSFNRIRNNHNQLHHHQHYNHQHRRHSEAPRADLHRPSDASLYDAQSCAAKSNYSSSGGSSSGIGVSGSTYATNTPTTGTFPFSSFTANFKADQVFGLDLEQTARPLLTNAQTMSLCNAYPMQQFPINPYLLDMNQMLAHQLMADKSNTPNICQNSTCASRKYSLPVQLESQSNERSSPTNCANRLLFEKNLQRVDSVNLSPSSQGHHFHYLQNGGHLPGSVMNAHLIGQQQSDNNGKRSEQRRLFDSRLSSQTITRQSSFWLEDDTADSIFSLATSGIAGLQSDDGSQLDVNNLQLEEKTSVITDIDGQSKSEERTKRRNSSQRPSIGSIVQSGDSIESVKQRPMAADQNVNPDDANVPEAPERMPLGTNSDQEESCSLNTADQTREPGAAERHSHQQQKRRIAHLRGRLSSSSTNSSTGSSSSPDFGRLSGRILGIATKSSSISKRHAKKKIRCRSGRHYASLRNNYSSENDTSKPIAGNASLKGATHQNSAPGLTSRTRLDSSEDSRLDDVEMAKQNEEGQQEPTTNDGVFEGTNEEHPLPDLNPASMERQCRELWKLRAALHDDSCVADDWANYHQRLNRRYDSGYKSIENQLSSSLEGNLLAASSSLQAALIPTAPPADQQSSGSPDNSRLSPIDTDYLEQSCLVANNDANVVGDALPGSDVAIETHLTETQQENCPVNSIEGKLADLYLDDVPLDSLLSNPVDRDCQSRSSRSSNEEDKKAD